EIPQLAEVATVEVDDAGVERVRIDIVVEREIDDAPATGGILAAEQKGAALAHAAPALAQLRKKPPPEPPRERQLMPRREQAAGNRGNGEVHGRAPGIERGR